MKRLFAALLLLAAPLRAGFILETTDSIEIITTTAAAVDYNCSWTDNTTTAFTPGKTAGAISSATTTTVVAAPAASTQRSVQNCTFRNTSTTTANALTVQRDVSATNRTMYAATLAPGETLAFTGERFFRYTASGAEATTYADAGYNGKTYPVAKVGTAKDSAGYAIAYSKDAGMPGASVPGAPGLNGWTTDCSTATNAADPAGAAQLGAHLLQDPATGNLYLTRVSIAGSVAAEAIDVIDVLWYNTGLVVATLTAQTTTSPALPARDINGSTNGDGVNLALLTTTANTNAAAIATTTAIYTDSDGNTPNTATFPALVGFQAPASPVIGTWMPFSLAAGDRGILALTSVTLGTSYVAGALSAVLYRTLITLPNNVAYSPAPVEIPAPGIRVYPNSCIWFVVRGTASAATLAGSYTILER